MALRPEQVYSDEDISAKVKELESSIDVSLRSKWKGDGPVVWKIPSGTPPVVIKALIQRYRQAGWTVKHDVGSSYDPRDRDSWSWNNLILSAQR